MTKAKASTKETTGRSAEDSIRAFVALDPDAMTVRRIARVAEHLRMTSGAPSATWTPPEKMHVTLKFIAELPANTVTPLGDAVGEVASTTSPPRGGVVRLEAFPSTEEATIVILLLEDPSGHLRKLAEQTEKIATRLGVPRESRAFRPHVTLARLKRAYDARRWLRPDLAASVGDCKLSRLTLYRSVAGEHGSVYAPLARFEFAPA